MRDRRRCQVERPRLPWCRRVVQSRSLLEKWGIPCTTRPRCSLMFNYILRKRKETPDEHLKQRHVDTLKDQVVSDSCISQWKTTTIVGEKAMKKKTHLKQEKKRIWVRGEISLMSFFFLSSYISSCVIVYSCFVGVIKFMPQWIRVPCRAKKIIT
jgi:hypothetical protein